MFWVLWFGLSFLVAMVANGRFRSAGGWFLLSLVISPLLALVILLVLPVEREGEAAYNLERGRLKRCPYCAEAIQAAAIRCRYCGADLNHERLLDPPAR